MRVAALLALLVTAASGQEVRSERRFIESSGVLQASDPFLAVGARWSRDVSPGLELRASVDGFTWSKWVPVQPSPDSPPDSQAGALVFFEWDSRFLEYRFAEPASVELTLIDPGRTPPGKLSALRKPKQRDAWFKPPVVSRIDWGCPDGDHAREPLQYTTVTHLIVHHTGDSFPSNDYPAWIRAIWRYHVFSNGWIDIGYNYLIDPEGTVYEGRAGGDNVLGAHFSCQNGGTMGVALLGTYTAVLPAPAALDSLASLLAWKADQLKIDPLARALHKGSGLDMFTISGHRDGNTSAATCTVTECPGASFYPALPGVRLSVADLIAAVSNSPLAEDAEKGPGEWTATGLWHVTTRRSFSGSHAWWYGREDTGNYDSIFGSNRGNLESPEFTLGGPATLTFRSWHETEDDGTTWDRKVVELQVDGGGWQTLDVLSGGARQWTLKSYPLNVTGRARIRFRFDTVDAYNNTFEGWYIDDIRVN